MSTIRKFQETAATYRKHGWRLARALMTPEALAELRASGESNFDGEPVAESEVDALWFTRPSHAGREAWELRLVADTPYALFELFEPDELEEERDDVRREMEARLRDYAKPG